jgi:hypothetical protein
VDVRLRRGTPTVSGEDVPPAPVETQNGSPRERLGVRLRAIYRPVSERGNSVMAHSRSVFSGQLRCVISCNRNPILYSNVLDRATDTGGKRMGPDSPAKRSACVPMADRTRTTRRALP